MRFLALLALATVLVLPPAPARADDAGPEATPIEQDDTASHHGVLHHVLFYLPNRVFDVLDLVRARVRIGPGFAVDARATQAAAVFLGGYTSLYVGLPGPRGEPRVPLPIGFESDAGIQVSLAKGRSDQERGPGYGPLEVGAGAQLALIGIDLGLEPFELLDLVTGLLFIDLRDDDL